jgi:serine/threonine protein kinase
MADLVGKTLGPYQIQALLGAGGMGQVYRAHDPRLDREVAIKVLAATLAQEPGYSARFQREAKAAAKLSHPNIVPVFDVGEQGGLMYLVMPLIPGGTLREYLAQRGALPLSEAISIVEQVAGALQQAHERGMIHRDVKPANILMSAEGRALLTDFGIVRVAQNNESATPLTRIGSFVGSPEYAAPEMVTGQSADHRVDIYALGVMLYQMLTGRLPFVGSNAMALLMQRVQQEPPAPRSVNPAIPPAVEAVIMKAMAKAPAARYQSATELVQALKTAAGGQAAPTLYGETGTQSQMSDLSTIAGSGPAAPGAPGWNNSPYVPTIPVPPPVSGPAAAAPPTPGWASGPAAGAPPPASGWASPGWGGQYTPPPAPTFMTELPGAPASPPVAVSPPARRRRSLPLLLLGAALLLIVVGAGLLGLGLSTGFFKGTTAGVNTTATTLAQGSPAATSTKAPTPTATPLPTYYYMARYFALADGDLRNGDVADTTINLNNTQDYTNHEGAKGDIYQMGDALSYGWQFGTATVVRDSNGKFIFAILVDRLDSYQHTQQYLQRDLTLFQSHTLPTVGEEALAGIIPEKNQQTYQLIFRDRNIVVTIATVPMSNAQGFSDYFLSLAQSLDQHGQRCTYDITTLKPLPSAPSDCT